MKSHPQLAALRSHPPSLQITAPFGDEDSAVEPASSVAKKIDDPGGGADDNVPGGGSINSVGHDLDDPGGGTEQRQIRGPKGISLYICEIDLRARNPPPIASAPLAARPVRSANRRFCPLHTTALLWSAVRLF